PRPRVTPRSGSPLLTQARHPGGRSKPKPNRTDGRDVRFRQNVSTSEICPTGARQIKRQRQPRVASLGPIEADQEIFEGHVRPPVNVTPSPVKITPGDV